MATDGKGVVTIIFWLKNFQVVSLTLFSFPLCHVLVGVPIKLLHEAEKHIITVELKNGEIYKGQLAEAEDTMNCQMKEGKSICTTFSFSSTSFNSKPQICTTHNSHNDSP